MENLQINKLDYINNQKLFNRNIRQKYNNISKYNNEINNKLINKYNFKNYNNLNKEKMFIPFLNNNISVTNKNIKLFLQTNKLEVKTDKNIKNHILRRNGFLRRYDKSAEINNRLNELKNNIKKVNFQISKVIDINNEDIPQLERRFNFLFSKFEN